MNRYNNYHKHDHISSIITPDSNAHIIDYINRAKELNEKNVFTTNHGTGGDIFEAKSLCDANDMNCKFGLEGYIVENPLEKDSRNYHIILIPKTNIARKKLNKANSRAHKEGYYYKPRLFLDDLLNNFDSNELYITTACVAGLLRDENAINNIFLPLYEKFGKNVFLEVQTHTQEIQKAINEKAIHYSKELGLYLIGANDSHYIYPEQSKERLELLKGKGISYDDEDSFMLDYPNYEEMANRFIKQGILTKKQTIDCIEQTLIFDECENININKNIKMPTIYKNYSDEDKIKLLKETINQEFINITTADNVDKNKKSAYIKEIQKEMKVIEDTTEIHTVDYFLLNYKLTKLAINKYGGVLTRSGRGSGGAFIINKMLGITQIDRLSIDLPIYSERFMSTARILENRALPDIDFNVAKQEPFVKASKELLGENGCYPMVAYGTMKESEAFRNICRSNHLPYEEFNEVGKSINNYRQHPYWSKYINEAQKYIGTIISASVHPCSYLLSNDDIESEIGVIKIGNAICAMITSSEADEWKYLKNDYLIVIVWDIIAKTFKLINKPIITIKELLQKIDNRVWDLFANGMTATLNQVDGDWATKLLKTYKPKSLEELSMFVGCIRPNFEPFRDSFINRKEFSTGSKDLDNLFEQTNHYIIFQENLMQFFEWLDVPPSESIGLIKKISKKKIKPQDFEKLSDDLKESWIKKVGTIEGFAEIWEDMQSQMSYGFNCVSGDTMIYRNKNSNKPLTIEEMYKIKNDKSYAKKHNHISLHQKYNTYGYGKAYSLQSDTNKIKYNNIEHIDYAGKRLVYKVTTENGKTICCTDNHKFPTPNGKLMLKELNVGDELYIKCDYKKINHNYNLGNFEKNYPNKSQQGFQKTNTNIHYNYNSFRNECIKNKKCCEICDMKYDINNRFEVHHKDFNRKNNHKSNYQWLCCSCHKKVHFNNNRKRKGDNGYDIALEKIVSIEYIGLQDVYNVTMADPYHNFVVNDGIVTSNSPHGVATAIDCLYCAYLKINYPLEYYSVVLNIYSNNVKKTNRLLEEMKCFNIKLSNPMFRYSTNNYGINKAQNIIYKGLASIKDIGKNNGDELYLLKDNEYNSFVDLLKDIKEKTSVNSKQLDILIKLNFFSEFGDINYLLYITEIYDKFGNSKVLTKSKLNDFEFECAKKVCKKETAKQFRDFDTIELLNELLNVQIPKTTITEKIKYELLLLGHTDLYDDNVNDNIYGVELVDDDKYGRHFVNLYHIKDKESHRYKVDKNYFKQHPLSQGDIIKAVFDNKEKIRKTDDGFVKTGEFEQILKLYSIQ